MSEFCQDRNLDAGAVERDRQGLERCNDWFGGGGGSEDTSQEQFVLGLCSMAASAQARCPHVVIFFCFWLLLGMYVFVKNLKEKIWQRKFCSDVYNNLAIGLTSFFVSPDVVFSFFDLAEQNVHSTAWECALARQNVFALYGLYAQECASFEKWHKRVPVVSWIYDEMVMAHVGSQFHHFQESMLEILAYRKRHRRCSPTSACLKTSDSYKLDIDKWMMRLLCVIHSVASGLNISDHLRANLCISLAVFKCHRVTFHWMLSVTNDAPVGTASGLAHLRLASRVLSWQVRNTLSRHLDPFLFPIPDGNLAWPNLSATSSWKIIATAFLLGGKICALGLIAVIASCFFISK